MNALADRIARRIRGEGPLSLAAFMAIALHEPALGYYARRNPLGSTGDFVTAPEISQIFGELIGLCCADWWQRSGRPDRVVLVELGPGRGTLMADFLRAAATVPGFCQAVELYLVETSPVLQAQQQERLCDAQPQFVDSIDALPDGPLLLVANEFLDALPVRQFVRGRVDWGERLVGVDRNGERLVFVDGPESPLVSLLVAEALRGEAAGAVVEVCPAAAALAAALGTRLARQPGMALFIDYGFYPSRPGATLAAIRAHRSTEVLDDPGDADLSAHVDFAAFATVAGAAGASVHGPVSQQRFLIGLGAELRLARLIEHAAPAQRSQLRTGVARLLDPAEMGTLFKVLALTSPGLPAPAGFEGE